MSEKQFQDQKIVLIDGHSILNRAFYGLPDLTNAVTSGDYQKYYEMMYGNRG